MEIKVMARGSRGCGTRKVGGLYIYAEGVTEPCSRLAMPLPKACPCCGEEIRQMRSVRMINPLQLWGNCKESAITHPCHNTNCFVCFPDEHGALMWVGREYTPESFVEEALKMGVSKRIPFLPKDLKIGDRLFLVHNDALPAKNDDGTVRQNRTGVFFAVTITSFHKIISEKQSNNPDYIEKIINSGVTPVLEVDSDDDTLDQTITCKPSQRQLLDF